MTTAKDTTEQIVELLEAAPDEDRGGGRLGRVRVPAALNRHGFGGVSWSLGEAGVGPAPRKYSDEMRERVVRMVIETREGQPALAHERACHQAGRRSGPGRPGRRAGTGEP